MLQIIALIFFSRFFLYLIIYSSGPNAVGSILYRLLTAQKMKFSINDFFSKCDQKFGHIYWRNP